jgi:hypothetical protein
VSGWTAEGSNFPVTVPPSSPFLSMYKAGC